MGSNGPTSRAASGRSSKPVTTFGSATGSALASTHASGRVDSSSAGCSERGGLDHGRTRCAPTASGVGATRRARLKERVCRAVDGAEGNQAMGERTVARAGVARARRWRPALSCPPGSNKGKSGTWLAGCRLVHPIRPLLLCDRAQRPTTATDAARGAGI